MQIAYSKKKIRKKKHHSYNTQEKKGKRKRQGLQAILPYSLLWPQIAELGLSGKDYRDDHM